MWHEARRREKATQKLLHEHKKRADRRREENKIDPNSLLQIHGFKSKLCLEPGVYKQAVRSLVAWQGDKSITIDRFDVRATLSSIPSAKSTSRDNTVLDSEESKFMKKLLNYERYRLLIQNDLNKVPEELRLKLVAKSDMASDAKMKKLRNNKFGTSGEASISYSNQVHNNAAAVIFNRHMQVRDQPSKRGATIGYNYNSVPPPASLSEASKYDDITKSQDNDNDNSRDQTLRIADEIDNFELDGIQISNFEAKKLNDIAKKYGLSGEELLLLARRDKEDLNSAQLLKEIIKLNKNRDKAEKGLNDSANDQVYGPALPPKLMDNNLSSSSSEEEDDDDDDDNSPVRQRSPSGANIPLRNGSNRDPSESDNELEVNEVIGTKGVSESNRSSPEKPMKLKSPSHSISPSPAPEPSPLEQSTSCVQSDTATKFKHLLEESKEIEELVSSEQKQLPARMPPRRAPTPLAYKRNRRSSRSLSRERRSNRHQSNNHKASRRSRRRSRSQSSPSPSPSTYSTTTSSKSSPESHFIRRTSSSDCSSESSTRASKRRARRSRSKSRRRRKGDSSPKSERKSKHRNHRRS